MISPTFNAVTIEQNQLRDLVLSGRVEAKDLTFCEGLVKEAKLSLRQAYWVGKMIEKANNNPHPLTGFAAQAQGWQPDPVIKLDVTKIVAMFESARKHLKFPKVTLLMNESDLKSGVRFSFDRKGRNLLWVNDQHSYGVTYASINLDTGVVDLRRYGQKVKTEFMKLLENFSKKPIEMAILHGKLTGNCCFCSLPLTDERSLQCGYGDTCARHYRLPWGKQNNMTAIGDWALNGVKVAPKERTFKVVLNSSLWVYIENGNRLSKVVGNEQFNPDSLTKVQLDSLLQNVKNELSPENLTCDGELRGQKLREKKNYLTTVKEDLEQLL
jgi:hypothetical protein